MCHHHIHLRLIHNHLQHHTLHGILHPNNAPFLLSMLIITSFHGFHVQEERHCIAPEILCKNHQNSELVTPEDMQEEEDNCPRQDNLHSSTDGERREG